MQQSDSHLKLSLSRGNSMRHSSLSGHGLTLIEVLVALAIMGILASMAVPAFQDTVKRHRSKATAEDLSGILQLARAEAIRRAAPVVLERIPSCAVALANADDWSCGWQLYADTNRDQTAADSEVIQSRDGVASHGVTHSFDGGGAGASVAFTRWGHAQPASHRFVIEPRPTASATTARTVCLNASGRLRVLDGVVECI